MPTASVISSLDAPGRGDDFQAGSIDDKLSRYDPSCPPTAEEAADMQHREKELCSCPVRDHVVRRSDYFVIVVDHGGADQLAHPIDLRHDRKIDLMSCTPACMGKPDRPAGGDASAGQIIQLESSRRTRGLCGNEVASNAIGWHLKSCEGNMALSEV